MEGGAQGVARPGRRTPTGSRNVLPDLVEVESILTPMQGVQTCHLDLWSDNLRRDDRRRPCAIDFDNAGPQTRDARSRCCCSSSAVATRVASTLWTTAYREAGGPGRVTGRESLALTVAQLHHIGHRHVTMWIAARDDEARARSLAGVEEFLGEPLLLPDVDRLVAAVVPGHDLGSPA